WLAVKKNEAYPVFTNASTNDPPPWPDELTSKKSGQMNAFFRWANGSDTTDGVEVKLFLVKAAGLKTSFTVPTESTADVSLRRVQKLKVAPGATVYWTFGSAKGEARADAQGVVTIAGLTVTAEPATLSVKTRSEERRVGKE